MSDQADEAWLLHLISTQDTEAVTEFLRVLCLSPNRMTPGVLSLIGNMLAPEADALPLKMTVASRKRGAKPKVARNISLVEKIAAKNGDRQTLDFVLNELNAMGVTDDSLKRELRRLAQEHRDNEKRMAELIAEYRASQSN